MRACTLGRCSLPCYHQGSLRSTPVSLGSRDPTWLPICFCMVTDARGEWEMLRANDVASVILSRRAGFTDAMTLQKLLYYAQAWHLAVTSEPLFQEQIKAWKDGPVVPQVWHDRKDTHTRRQADQDVEGVNLSDMASDLIDLVLETYGSLSGRDLSALTHEELPWLEARGDTPNGENSSAALRNSTMARFYRDPSRTLGRQVAVDIAAGGVSRSNLMPGEIGALVSELPRGNARGRQDDWSVGEQFVPQGSWRERRTARMQASTTS